MVELTVNLTPALTGVTGEMWVMLLVGGEGIWYYLIDIPSSVNGVIGPFSYADPYTINIHQIRFPEQTINGVTYQATQTDGFMTTEDWPFYVTFTPKEEPSPPPSPPPTLPSIVPIVAIAFLAFIMFKK